MIDYLEAKIKHLEMIQIVITRMASNSFLLKGWAVTIVTGIFVLAAKEALYGYFIISYIPILLFWFLDAYYLAMERRFRELYNTIKDQETEKISFDLTPPKADETKATLYSQSLISRTELGFYLPLALLIIAVILIPGIV